MILFGEPKGNYVSMWLFYQNYVDMEYWSVGMAPLCSVSLDMQMHIILPLILYIIYTYRKSISVLYLLYVLIGLSIIYSLIVFNPRTMDILTISLRYNSMAPLMPEHISEWIKSTYNVTFPFVTFQPPNPIKLFMERLYLPLLSRYSSFIIGSILSFKIIDANYTGSTRMDSIKKCVYSSLIWFYLLIVVMPPPSPNDEQPAINDLVLKIFVSCGRQLFAIGQAFLLFSALCPISHPYHSIWVKNILSFRIWSPIAKLSYLLYVLHFRIAFELIMGAKLRRYSINYTTLLHLAVVFLICLVIACILYILVERPFERLMKQIFTHKVYKK